MPIAFTSRARLKDWKALQELHETTLLERAKACGASRFGFYRNAHDAAQFLLIAEFGATDGLREFLATWFDTGGLVCKETASEELWEPLGWSVIP